MNKKGISPLIATVLLIGFTIALAAIVMTWGTSFIKSTTEETGAGAKKTIACASLNLDIKGADCKEGLTIANNNDINIIKLAFRNYDATGKLVGEVKTKEGTPILGKFDVKNFGASEIGLATGVKKVEVIPTLEGDITCAEAPISKIITC